MSTSNEAAKASSKVDTKADRTKGDKRSNANGNGNDNEVEASDKTSGVEEQRGVSKWARRIGRVVVAVLALLGVLWIIDRLSGGDASPEQSQVEVVSPVPPAGGTGVLGGERGFGFVDLFERPEGETWLGDASANNSWLEITGTWESTEGVARVVEPSERGPSIAVYNLGTADATIEADFEEVEVGSGLVFRFRNVLNHWQVRAAPAAGTWVVVRVAEGEATTVATLGLAPVESGTRIAVTLDGDRILFYADGLLKAEVVDSSFQNATRVGLLAQPDDATSYRSFVAIGHSKNAFGTDPNGPDPDDADFDAGDDAVPEQDEEQ